MTVDFKDYLRYDELHVARNLMHAIWCKFPDGLVYIVGGVPRDIILGHPIADVDLATNIPFEQLGEHFPINDISKNGAQPVYKIDYCGYSFDIAAFRVDSKTFGRSNNVSTLTQSLEEDTSRRDITIISLALNELGDIIDYHGGINDIRNRIIRCVGDPITRFQEDASRILRVLRFQAKLGFRLDGDTALAIFRVGRELISNRSAITPEAISKEIYKASKSGHQLWQFLCALIDYDLRDLILPELDALRGFYHDPAHHPEGGSTVIGHIYACLRVSPYTDPVTNLGVLFHDLGKATTRDVKENGHSSYHGHEEAGIPIVDGIFERLRFPDLSAQDKDDIRLATGRHMLIHNISEVSTKKLVKLYHNPGWPTLVKVAHCDEASRGAPLYDGDAFWAKIRTAEERAQRVAPNKDELRLKLKKYVDGHKVKEWFPIDTDLDPKLTGRILEACCDFIVEKLEASQEPTQDEIREVAQQCVLSGLPIVELVNG